MNTCANAKKNERTFDRHSDNLGLRHHEYFCQLRDLVEQEQSCQFDGRFDWESHERRLDQENLVLLLILAMLAFDFDRASAFCDTLVERKKLV